jgi:adenylate kinase
MPDRYKTVLLFGPPGVGKGTQGKLLGQVPGMKHLATGDMFRGLDRTAGLGQRIHAIMSAGTLVPDELTVELWQQYVRGMINAGRFRPEAELLVLDGIPRSANQARALGPFVEVLKVIHLTCPNIDEMVARMKRRAIKENRPDDADEAVIRRRFEVYEKETRPVLDCYDPKLVCEINAVGTPAEVLLHILQALVPAYNKHFGNPLG